MHSTGTRTFGYAITVDGISRLARNKLYARSVNSVSADDMILKLVDLCCMLAS